MDGEGFEPSKSSTTDLQSAPFGRSGTHPCYFYLILNGTNRARTCDPLLVRQVLSQLSYDPSLAVNKTTQIGLEPTTSAVTGRRSNQLSHWAKQIYIVCTFKTESEMKCLLISHPITYLRLDKPSTD